MFQDGSQPPPTYSIGKDRPQQKGCLLYKSATRPVGSGAGTPGANAGARTSSQALGPVPTVPTVTPGGDAPADQASRPPPVIADQTTGAAQPLGWVHPEHFKEGCVCHHTVSRTLNSLFKVLFKFPSLYLFAIGLGVIFSLTRSLPGTLDSTLKLSDSGKRSAKSDAHLTGLAPSMGCGHCQVGL